MRLMGFAKFALLAGNARMRLLLLVPILRAGINISSPEIRFQKGPGRISGKLTSVVPNFLQQEEDCECQRWKCVCQDSGNLTGERVELCSPKLYKLESTREARVQERSRIPLREGSDMSGAELVLGRMSSHHHQ